MLKRNPCLKHCRMVLKIWKKYWLITAHLNFNFWYCKPILKAIQGQKLEISCSKWTFCHMLEHSKLYSSPFSPAHTTVGREESPNMWHSFLGQVIIFFYGLMRVILKSEVREITFGHAVIAWNFSWSFYCCKITSFGPLKVGTLNENARSCALVFYYYNINFSK